MQKWCFFLSLGMLAIFGVLCLTERLVRNIGELQQSKLRIAKFACLVISGGTLVFGWQRDVSFQGVAESLYAALKMFFADGKLYETTNPPLSSDSKLAIAYFALYYVICGIAVYCTAAAVISLFKNLAALRKLNRRGRWKNLCVFSELNERTLAIAESIRQNTKNGYPITVDQEATPSFFTGKPQTLDNATWKLSFVFCDVFEQHAEHSFELVERANKLGALCLKNDITEVHARLRRAKCYHGSQKRMTRFFLAGADEAENVRQAIVIADTEREITKEHKRFKNLAIFVFANGEVNGKALDSLNDSGEEKATFFVRRLSPSRMLAYDVLTNKKNYLVDKQAPEKPLQVLVTGMGQYGMELVKMLCWFYQRHIGGITVHVVDRERGVADRMRALCPGLVDYTSSEDATEDMQFSLVFHEEIDLFSDSFCTLLKSSLPNVDAAFVTLGDDDLNAEAAALIRRTLDRAHYTDFTVAFDEKNTETKTTRYIQFSDAVHTDFTRIFAVVHNDKRCSNFAKCSQYNVEFVGNDSAVYDYNNIYDYQKETMAIIKHQKQKKYSSVLAVNSYNANEYDRLSSLAKAYYLDLYEYLYGKILVDTPATQQQLRTENKRWNAYLRSIGYICINDAFTRDERDEMFHQKGPQPARRWMRGKWHNSITPFSNLGENEQNNNVLK